MVMIPLQKGIHRSLTAFPVLGRIASPAKAFLPHCAVEALNVSLLILLVGPCDPMASTVGLHPLQERLLELTAPIGLDEPYVAAKAPGHSLFQEGTAVSGC